MTEDKPFCISKWAVLTAWTKVRENRGAAGVDGVSIQEFERKLKNNLYRVWNRMSSGTLWRALRCLNRRLVRRLQNKYKRYRTKTGQATLWLRRYARQNPGLFAHWDIGLVP